MAGGEGAKERRRLKRLQAAGVEGKSVDKPAFVKNHPKNKRRQNTAENGKRVPVGKKPFHKGPKFGGKPNPQDAKKKNKVKKPKHLKRKLEQAVEADEQTKGELQRELQDWERRKEIFSQNPKRRRQGREGLQPSTAPAVMKETVEAVTQTEPSFPRNTAPKQKKEPEGRKMEEPEDEADSTDDSSVEEEPPEKETKQDAAKKDSKQSKPEKVKLQSDSEDSDSDSDSDSDDSDSDDDGPTARRQRGRRRRGRKDTAKKIEETKEAEIKTESSTKLAGDALDKSNNTEDSEKKRYCIGRKPVTDFTLGQTYPGTVVYVKPFGVFLDIGCHSDAFCHVSRLSDDYVESPESLFKEGDSVKDVRVVEIDRKRKRITVSLQTEVRLDDERASMEARKQRKEQRATKKGSSSGAKQHKPADAGQSEPRSKKNAAPMPSQPKKDHSAPPQAVQEKDPSLMTPGELKRARKLARRAARREQAGEEALQ